ncbi:MAG TPA: hypothetical protein VKR32_04460, partial [Puia sp.]|nr:hypothetical protein [Puia sp.]
MNIAEYISSGIIESYILGLASPEERAEFESMCASYPEILKARVEFENSLERHFLNDPAALSPSPEIKERILGEIMGRDGTEKQKLPAYPLQPVKLGWWRFIAAAAVVLLLGSTMLNYYFFKQ